MTTDELAVCEYLKAFPGAFVSGKEVCRRAGGKRRAAEDPRWAIPVLRGLLEQRIVESDATGHFRLIQKQPQKAGKKWVSPQVLRLLKASGKNFDEVFEINESRDGVQSLTPSRTKAGRKGTDDPDPLQTRPRDECHDRRASDTKDTQSE